MRGDDLRFGVVQPFLRDVDFDFGVLEALDERFVRALGVRRVLGLLRAFLLPDAVHLTTDVLDLLVQVALVVLRTITQT